MIGRKQINLGSVFFIVHFNTGKGISEVMQNAKFILKGLMSYSCFDTLGYSLISHVTAAEIAPNYVY